MHLSAKEKNAIFKNMVETQKTLAQLKGKLLCFQIEFSHLTDHLKNNHKDKKYATFPSNYRKQRFTELLNEQRH